MKTETEKEILERHLKKASPFGTATVSNPIINVAMINAMKEHTSQFTQPKVVEEVHFTTEQMRAAMLYASIDQVNTTQIETYLKIKSSQSTPKVVSKELGYTPSGEEKMLIERILKRGKPKVIPTEEGFIDWNNLNMEELVTYLTSKFQYQSSGTAYAIMQLVNFYNSSKSVSLPKDEIIAKAKEFFDEEVSADGWNNTGTPMGSLYGKEEFFNKLSQWMFS